MSKRRDLPSPNITASVSSTSVPKKHADSTPDRPNTRKHVTMQLSRVAVAMLVILGPIGCVDPDAVMLERSIGQVPNPWIPVCRACVAWQTPVEAYFFHLDVEQIASASDHTQSFLFSLEALQLAMPVVDLPSEAAQPYALGEFHGEAWHLPKASDTFDLAPLDEVFARRPPSHAIARFEQATCVIPLMRSALPPTVEELRAWVESPKHSVAWCDQNVLQ